MFHSGVNGQRAELSVMLYPKASPRLLYFRPIRSDPLLIEEAQVHQWFTSIGSVSTTGRRPQTVECRAKRKMHSSSLRVGSRGWYIPDRASAVFFKSCEAVWCSRGCHNRV